jgi:microcystin-dependent protein
MAQSLPISRQVILDNNGRPASGAQAYYFAGGTTTPLTVYADFALTTPHARPVVADAYGRMPRIYVSPGTYLREQVVANSVQLWQDDVQLPVETTGGGGGGGTTVDLSDLLDTGDIVIKTKTGNVPGFVRCNARTIGSASSGATERANDDCLALFSYLWNTVSDAYCPVSGGRSSTAAADWALNKTIQLPDFRGRAIVGLNAMGNSAAAALSGFAMDSGSTDTLLSPGGAKEIALTVPQMPTHDHGGATGASANSPTSLIYGTFRTVASGSDFSQVWSGTTTNAIAGYSHSHTISSQGGGTAHPNCQPFVVTGVYMKLERITT